MALIIDIRGVNGSGKSTLIKSFLGDAPDVIQAFDLMWYEGKVDLADKLEEVIGTWFNWNGVTGVALGRYDKPSGGCDATHRQDQICNRVRKFATQADFILFEGVIVATIAERYIKLAQELEELGHTYKVGYLTTSLEQCIENIGQRRGTSVVSRKPFNEELLRMKDRNIKRTRPKFERAGIGTFDLTWPNPYEDLRRMIAAPHTR